MAETDVIVIGAGVSGLATVKSCLEEGLTVTCLESAPDVGGLWRYRDTPGGVMAFTFINVGRFNYAFSDHPFPDGRDYASHDDMFRYIRSYVDRFDLRQHIQFQTSVTHVRRGKDGTGWHVDATRPNGEQATLRARFLAVASGHHTAPHRVTFPGQQSFPGAIVHSSVYKDAALHGYKGRRLLVVGIGNSAVDVAENAVVSGCQDVTVSTRSGAWVMPNYINGFSTDLYACRLFLWLPLAAANAVFETVLQTVTGPPQKFGLNPVHRALNAQPTVSPTLLHRIQRGQVAIRPNISKFDGDEVTFDDGTKGSFDVVVQCTGYDITLPFLPAALQAEVLDPATNAINLFKNVFSPTMGPSLAFIGFVQPASGGLISISEMQARWFVAVASGNLKLPSVPAMQRDIAARRARAAKRYKGRRHTIQEDPILYCDDVGRMLGVKPSIWRHPRLAYALLFGSGGSSQWRLQGRHSWPDAAEHVLAVPVPTMYSLTAKLMKWMLLLSLLMLVVVVLLL